MTLPVALCLLAVSLASFAAVGGLLLTMRGRR